MNIIELAIAAQLIDHRDTSESLPPEFVCSLNEFATLVRAAALEEAAKVAEEPYEFTSQEASRIATAIRALKENT